MDNMRRFKFIKDFTCQFGTIPEGSEIEYFNGMVSMNGGILDTAFQGTFLKLIKENSLRNTYLKELNFVKNEI